MTTIAHTLAGLDLGPPQAYKNLAVFPLFARDDAPPDYLTLDEALDAGAARISEVSESGSVPELCFVNGSAEKILLVDGEELVGARQNRILNLSILVGARQTVVIPVSCVERGRWSYRGRHFGSARRSLYANARAAKMRDVSTHMRATGSRASDQGRVWADIERKQQALRVDSPTEAMADLYEARERDTAGYETRVHRGPPAGGRGLRHQRHRPRRRRLRLGADVPQVPAEAARQLRAGRGGGTGRRPAAAPTLAQVRAFLAQLPDAPETRYKALAEGEDVRLESPRAAAGALEVGGKVVHLAAFAVEG